jgi:hypothetical protein
VIGDVMSHAVNSPKPWARDYVKSSLDGKPPSLSDKGFWDNAERTIRLFPESVVRKRRLALKAAIPLAESGVVLKPADAAADLRTPSGPVFA